MVTNYHLISENDESTVVLNYDVTAHTGEPEVAYESEAALEHRFISQLQQQAYEYLPIHTEADLVSNLRAQLERLNGITFTDQEWKNFFDKKIANTNYGIADKSRIIQEDYIQILDRDDGTQKNVRLIDKDNIHNNSLQVINQYVPAGGVHDNRYDVTILVNGLPLVHVELKRRGVSIREAFNQIIRYQRDSFWAGSGLYDYVQIFVISNGTETKYYSNTTRESRIHEAVAEGGKPRKATSNSFEFTSYWADAKNHVILDLMDFARTFFARHTILNILTHYCILTSEKLLLVMRPYQIAATERILQRIRVAYNNKLYGTIDAGGYIWHTTGSGKTLTSFKTARLASQLPYIDKVLFVVDRKDLDYQTMKEYDRFEKGAANGNTSTLVLERQLADPACHIIITTIQKLSSLIKRTKPKTTPANTPNTPIAPNIHAASQSLMLNASSLKIYDQHVVFIFDECHRSQFGMMHQAITKRFKKYYIFGFTGTPIFSVNAGHGLPNMRTTAQAFGDQLHTYTIVDAIADGNVLPFRVEYISTMRESSMSDGDDQVWGIDREKLLCAPQRITNVTKYILDHFADKCKRRDKSYEFRQLTNVQEMAHAQAGKAGGKVQEHKQVIRLTGFNSIFAVGSIPMAKAYYNEFKAQQASLHDSQRLRVATIYSYGVNGDDNQLLDDQGFTQDENPEDTTQLSQPDRDFLEGAISDYNAMFGTSYSTEGDAFQNYYKDVSLRMKNREIDILIVVNMFLTGFDATTLNTLWVDKNLRMHGLLQAFSRTNRILNSIKTFGNIVCFRDLEQATNDAIALFGDKDAAGIVLMRTFSEYMHGYTDSNSKEHLGYDALVQQLLEQFPLKVPIKGEEAEKYFIKLWGTILKMRNILSVFDKFAAADLLTEHQVQDYTSIYLSLYEKYRKTHHESEDVTDDIEFEMELIKMIEVNIDYILALVKKYHEANTQDKQIEIRTDIDRAIDSSPQMRKKKDLIEAFIDSLTPTSNVDDDWNTFVRARLEQELQQLIQEENLKPEPARKFIADSFSSGYIETSGTALPGILPPMSRFGKNNAREEKKRTVIEKITAFFEKFHDLISTL